MMYRKFLSLLIGCAAACCCQGLKPAAADTVGLWLMDELVDVTPSPNPGTDPDPPGGETLYDASGKGLDLVASTNFGTNELSTDIPTIAQAGTFSLHSDQGGSADFTTASTSLLHRGKTGSMTVEFWYQFTRVTPSIGYIANFDRGDNGSIGVSNNRGDWGVYTNSNGDIRFYEFSEAGAFTEISVTDLPNEYDPADFMWHHVAYTIDAIGTMKSYLDGHLVRQKGSHLPSAAEAGIFTIGQVFESFPGVGQFGDLGYLIDDLRISDVALLPGAGSGVGELAWNASLAGPALMPDVNMDGVVNIFDINLVSSNWGGTGPAGDANKDGTVNIFDINLISANWTQAGAASAVPEPGSLALAAFGMIGAPIAFWHRRRRARC